MGGSCADHVLCYVQVVLQNCRGRVDPVVAPYLQLALQRYGSARKKLLQASSDIHMNTSLYNNLSTPLCSSAKIGMLVNDLATVLSAPHQSHRPGTQDLLLNVVASAFYYNAGLAMGALRAAGAVQHAFAAWLGGISAAGKHFRRLYDKKARPCRLQPLDCA